MQECNSPRNNQLETHSDERGELPMQLLDPMIEEHRDRFSNA
jgi:hypothetical protein